MFKRLIFLLVTLTIITLYSAQPGGPGPPGPEWPGPPGPGGPGPPGPGGPGPPGPFSSQYSIFEFGNPSIFVTTDSQHFDSYRLINRYKNTFLTDEYMIFASNKESIRSQLILYDLEHSNDVVVQNLGKEQYWAFINSTGTLPSMTVSNTTYRGLVDFHTVKDNEITFLADYHKSFISKETTPPYDAIIEVPGETGTFRATKTLVDFQSWGLLRWQLSDKKFVTWNEIKANVEALNPIYNMTSSWNVSASSFRRIDNPCLPDFFMMYLLVGDKESGIRHIYADVPAFHLNESIPNFYNLTGSFCPHYHAEDSEECGFVEQIILTNDHIVALTDKGLYISSSINSSDSDVSEQYEGKPLLSYVLIDPCARFEAYISCFKQGITTLSNELIHSIRLFYIPICNLFQYPFYEDRLILVIEHTSTDKNVSVRSGTNPPRKAITILHSSTPYKQWKALFIGKSDYENMTIVGLVGVFFNHQLRHFDITLKVVEHDAKNFHYRRFVLPDYDENLKIPHYEKTWNISGYGVIDGYRGRGFLQKRFPETLLLKEVVVNPGSMDVYFIGNQLWIAESAGALVYKSISGMPHQEFITGCSFSHPDRSFVCSTSNYLELIVGKVSSQYTPSHVKVDTIQELWLTSGIQGTHWTSEYAQKVMQNSFYTASFSGRILIWYLYDALELKQYQVDLTIAAPSKSDCSNPILCGALCEEHMELQEACKELVHRNIAEPIWKTQHAPATSRGPHFRMIAVNPEKLITEQKSTAGPLVPFFLDIGSVMLYEAKLSKDDAEYVYLSNVNVGQQILCINTTFNETLGDVQGNRKFNGRFYVRHIKPLERFLDGFRQVLYGTIITPIPLHPWPARVLVVQIAQSNLVFMRNISPLSELYKEEYVGQTHHFPGNFSVLIRGFPVDTDHSIVWGYSTIHVRKQTISYHEKFFSFRIDMSTAEYSAKHIKDKTDWDAYTEQLKNDKDALQEDEDIKWDVKTNIMTDYTLGLFSSSKPLFKMTKSLTIEQFDPLKVMQDWINVNPNLTDPTVPTFFNSSYSNTGLTPWTVLDGGCHHRLQLLPNSVLFGHGGRISLDLHDRVSFSVRLRPITELGYGMLYRPLIVVTNSNPEVLILEKRFTQDKEENVQSVDILIAPTGIRMGVSSITVRTIITSLKCTTPSSMTFIVQVHRAEGRRLFINYPEKLSFCLLSKSLGGYARKWKTDDSNCVPHSIFYHDDGTPISDEDKVIKKGSLYIFTRLEPNYRPPSIKGEQIPLSKNVYNADPDPKIPKYNENYHISKDSRVYKKCANRANRAACNCSLADKISDDAAFSDCKEWVYTVQRTKSYELSIEYDSIMRDEDQHPEFFSAKTHLSVYIEEVNNREEYTIADTPTKLLDSINSNERINEGRKFYNAAKIVITLHGTGLFHFKVGLGKFDSFEEVTGYFILYSDSKDLNHIKLAVVMLITITVCFSMIFFGFIRVRKRLSSQLPFQSSAKSKLE